ncbi:hypothetical protein MNBD_BACTEROID05-785, partial [hydrothermal vent metagenome]
LLPTAIMGNVDEGEHCFPSLFSIDNNTVLIGTTAHELEKNPIGKKFGLSIEVHSYEVTNAPGWKKVLYSGLSNLSKDNTNVSVLLLSTAVELYADYVFERYLEKKGVENAVRSEVIHSVRPWPMKAKRVSKVLESVMPNYDPADFNRGLEAFDTTVKQLRNKFSHEHSEDIMKPDAHAAYCAAFDLLWYFDSLDSFFTDN